jgi:hypothetical protein
MACTKAPFSFSARQIPLILLYVFLSAENLHPAAIITQISFSEQV